MYWICGSATIGATTRKADVNMTMIGITMGTWFSGILEKNEFKYFENGDRVNKS
jgi:hypothetical protein